MTEESSNTSIPNDNIFSLKEYREMYKVVSNPVSFYILEQFNINNPTPLDEVENIFSSDISSHVEKLRETNLIHKNIDSEENDCYTQTNIGRIILSHGAYEGVKKVASNEIDDVNTHT